jgi:hypothetical protein
MESLAKAIIEGWIHDKSRTSGGEFKFLLPIETICGIKVEAEIGIRSYKGNVETSMFRVSTYRVGSRYSFENAIDLVLYSEVLIKGSESFNTGAVIAYLEQILDSIPALRFDKKSIRFTKKFIYNDEAVAMFKFDNTTTKYKECSVCHELCGTKTECQHSLCLVCFSSIHEVLVDDEEEEGEQILIKSCPLCRKNVDYITN